MRKGLLFVMVLLLLCPSYVRAEETAKAYLICPMESSRSLSEHNADERYSAAGLSKLPALITLCYAFDNGWIDPNDTVTCSELACSASGPTAFLERGETVKAEELLKAAVMISAGDAILALMEHGFGSETVFLENVAVVLNEIGVEAALCSALGRETEFTCRELILLGNRAAKSESFCRYAAVYQDTFVHEDGSITELVNPNRMLRNYEGCIGLLTGSSDADGYCAVVAVQRGEEAYIAAIIGARNSEQRFSALRTLFDEVYANYALKTPAREGQPLVIGHPVIGGETKTVDLVSGDTVVLLLPKNAPTPTLVTDLEEALTAPLNKTEAVGTVRFQNEAGETMAAVQLYPANDVPSFGVVEVLRRFAAAFLGNGE